MFIHKTIMKQDKFTISKLESLGISLVDDKDNEERLVVDLDTVKPISLANGHCFFDDITIYIAEMADKQDYYKNGTKFMRNGWMNGDVYHDADAEYYEWFESRPVPIPNLEFGEENKFDYDTCMDIGYYMLLKGYTKVELKDNKLIFDNSKVFNFNKFLIKHCTEEVIEKHLHIRLTCDGDLNVGDYFDIYKDDNVRSCVTNINTEFWKTLGVSVAKFTVNGEFVARALVKDNKVLGSIYGKSQKHRNGLMDALRDNGYEKAETLSISGEEFKKLLKTYKVDARVYLDFTLLVDEYKYTGALS